MSKKVLAGLSLSLAFLVSQPGFPASYKDFMDENPEYFEFESGLRITKFRSETPDDIPPPAKIISRKEFECLTSAILIDSTPLILTKLKGAPPIWQKPSAHLSYPGSHWLPLFNLPDKERIKAMVTSYLEKITEKNKKRTIVIFCQKNCWVSWNAAQIIADLGYHDVRWLKEGIFGNQLVNIEPITAEILFQSP